MAGFLLVSGADSSLAIEALYRGGKDRRDPLLSSFEKEIDFILKPLLRRSKKALNHEACQKLSNSLFLLWNKYQRKLSLEFFTAQLLRVADLLYDAGLYHLARTQGYRRCLEHADLLNGMESLEDYVSSCDSKAVALAMLRCESGDAMCLYFLAVGKDPRLMEKSTRSLATSALNRLRRLSQVALLREDRYWLAHNAFVHSFSICRTMMKYGYSLRVIEYLIWCAVCMESSVPLMASQYLSLRTNLYVAVTQCYYSINLHNQAEIFARRALDKVNELAQIEKQSSFESLPDSECVYKESAVKLGVLIFKRSIFESHKKIKQPFKYKFRMTVKDLLQMPSPRSSTEKLLGEMFPNPNAQYLAILETLTDYSRRALNRGAPPQQEHENDIYLELFAAGLDLSLKTLAAGLTDPTLLSGPGMSIMEATVQDKITVPLQALVKFVRIAHIYEQKDVMEILGERIIQATQMSDDQLVISMGKALQLMLAMELLSNAHKRCVSATTHGGGGGTRKRGPSATPSVRGGTRKSSVVTGRLSTSPVGHGARLSPLLGAGRRLRRLSANRRSPIPGVKWERKPSPLSGGPGRGEQGKGRQSATLGGGGAGRGRGSGGKGRGKDEVRKSSGESGGVDSVDESHTTNDLHDALVKVIHFLHFTLQTTPSLVAIDYDLLLDSLVMCWELLRPALSCITTHDYQGCRAFLTHTTGMLFSLLLSELVAVSHWLELWRVDTLLHGELCLKHCCILEAKAESRDPPGTVDGVPVTFMRYDRSQLLLCCQELERVDSFIKLAREREMRGGVGEKEEVDGAGAMEGEELSTDLAILHAECVYALIRVQVKLASTNPPPDFFDCDNKASSLKSKVKVREDRQKQKQHLLSQLTSLEVKVPTVAELRQACGKSNYRQGVLLMLQATDTPGLEAAQKHRLMEESYNQLLLGQQWPADSQIPQTIITTTKSTSHLLPPPPPVLVGATETSMEFSPPPPPPPPPLYPEDTPPEQAAYYKLFGRVAAGSNVKVREIDKLFPGLGIEVPAEQSCRLVAHGLQPYEDYVFAVAAFTKEGAMMGGAIGSTSKPFRTSFSLPLLTAWGYCCQCAFAVGSKSVAMKSSKILWNHFVSDDSKHGRYRLKRSTIVPALSSQLHLFISSILISTQLGFTQSSLLADQLSTNQGQLLPNQLKRVELVRKLLVGVEVAGILNNAQLCLQIVVKCYGLLTPLLQHRISSRAVVEVLLHCQAVLLELPDSLLNSKSNVITASLHHMVAAIAFYVGKILLSWHNKSLFSRFTESTRSLMVVTLSGAVANSLTPLVDSVLEEATSATPMDQSSFVSSTQDPGTLSSFATVINSITTIQPTLDSGTKKKKGRKKVYILADNIPEENKTAELKALEAFLVANQQQIDDLDLSGGEDPIILHYIITSHPSIVAHRELFKFKRRPQFLEMLVHLLNLTLAKGHFDRAMEWAVEGFQWLTRRNEVLLNPRITQRIAGEQVLAGKAKLAKVSHLFSSVPSKMDLKKYAQRITQNATPINTVTVPMARSSIAPKQGRERITSGTETTMAKNKGSHGNSLPRSVQGRREAVASARQYSIRKSMMPSIAAELSSQVRITKEDLEARSVYMLITKLPELWRLHRCRKRLRSVSLDELPWRSQANLTLASCYLNQALGRLRSEFKDDTEGGEESGGQATSDGLRLDMAGVIIEGVVPALPAALAGQGNKPLSSTRSRTKERDGSGTTPSSVTLHPVQSTSILTLILDDIRHMMACYQRAAVLTERGKLWTMLQNVARSLWNAINTLLLAVSRLSREAREFKTAIIYGLACKPLYFVAEALTVLLEECGCGDGLLPQVSSLTFTPRMDDSNGVGVAVTKQVVFLAIHTLYVHQHWEKVVALGLKFDDVTNHSWADQLVPILSSAQSNLSDRIATHNFSRPIRHEKLEPAAHLDPGPKGYNVYGSVGFSLHLVSDDLLDKEDVLKRVDLLYDKAGGRGEQACQEILMDCRRLLQRYCAGVKEIAVSGGGIMEECLDKESPAVAGLCKPQVSVLVASYDKVLQLLQAAGKKDLTVQAMNELGDIMMLAGNVKMSRHWWLEGLSEVLGIKTPLTSWRQLLPITLKGCGGLWACLQGAMMATKLLRHVYWKHLDVRLECALLAAALLKTTLTYTLPYPSSDIAYATLDHTHSIGGGGASLFPGVELFSDPFRCNPSHLLCALHWCSRELVTRGYAKKSLPILWLYNHVAVVDCRAVQEAVAARILRLRALTQLSLFCAALQQLQELLTGSGLPQSSTHSARPAESSLPLSKFQDSLPISDQANSKILFALAERQLKPIQESLYGALNVSRLTVARSGLYISLAQSQSAPLGSTFFSLATGPGFSRQSNLSPRPSGIESVFSTTTASRDRESIFPHLMSASSRRSRPNIKLALIYSAERMLGMMNQHQEGNRSAEHVEMQVRALLGLARLAVTIQHCVTGYQLSLQGLRVLQILEEEGGEEGVALLREVDLYLWMECRYWMSRSVVGLETPPGGGSLLMEVGEYCEECGQHGEVELVAEMECTAAEHALTLLPCQLQAAQQHSQSCLEMLGSLAELSHTSELLSSKATLILSDTTSIVGTGPSPSQGGVASTGEQMVKIYDRLIKTIKKQISEEQVLPGDVNIYQPRYSLLASSLLRLGHTLILMANRGAGGSQDPISRRGLMQRAQECFKEGIAVVRESSQFDPSLSAELLIGNGLAMAALPELFKLDESISMLAKSGKMLVDGGTNYRLASAVFLTLAELYNKKRAKSLKRAGRKSVSIVINAQEPVKTTADQEKAGWEGKWDKGGWEFGGKEGYLAWCMVKSALKISTTRQTLLGFASSTNNSDMTKTLSDKILHELPDFILLELQSQSEILNTLSDRPILLPIESLLPSRQFRSKRGINWFKIISYYSRLIQRCYWQKVTLHLSESDWALHYNFTTPSVYAKAKAVFNFLNSYCTAFKACLMPSLPHLSMLPGSTFAGGVTSHREPQLVASDADVTVIWSNNPFSSMLAAKSEPPLPISDRITGYFAMNLKSVNFPVHAEPYILGIEMHVIHTSVRELSEVYSNWEQLAKVVSVYLDARAAMRPVSRSPSKQRKVEKSIQPPEEVVVGIPKAVREITTFLQSKAKLPTVEPHAVPSLTKVVEPFIQTSLKGDAYFFLRELFSHKQ